MNMKKKLLFVCAFGLSAVTYAQCIVSGPSPTMCVGDAPVSLSVASPGAVFSGPGVAGATFTPAAAGIGTHTISVTAPGDGYSHNTIPFSPTAIPSGTFVGGLSDDNVVGSFPIGFTFKFFGTDYTQFYVGSNGFITFSADFASGCCSGQVLPNASLPNNLIALAWNDLYPPAGGSVKYQTVGVSPNRILIVDYTTIGHCCSFTDLVTVQAKIFETTNCVQIHCASQPRTYGNHTMGIENSSGSLGYAAPGKNGTPWTATNFAYSFCPNVGCSGSFDVNVIASPEVTGTVDDVEICLGDEVTFTGSGEADVYSWGSDIDNGVPYAPLTPGANVFIVSGTDLESGCIGSDMVNVFVHEYPYVYAGDPITVCEDNEFVFAAVGDEATYVWDNGAVDGVPMLQDIGTVTYTVTATNEGGCESVSSTTVESVETPTGTGIVTMMTGDAYDGAIDFTPSGGDGGPYTFIWSNGATTEDIDALTVGSYTVVVSDGTCDSEVTFIVDSQAGIELEELSNLKVYPNPVVDFFTIEFEGTYNWILYDNAGKIIGNGKATGKEEISMENLASGNYLVKVAVDGKQSTITLVKK
jgi:hypothetical protein